MSSEITKECVHRLMLDVRDIMRNPMSDNGIYYQHDDADMLRGYAMIVDPKILPILAGFISSGFSSHTITLIRHRR